MDSWCEAESNFAKARGSLNEVYACIDDFKSAMWILRGNPRKRVKMNPVEMSKTSLFHSELEKTSVKWRSALEGLFSTVTQSRIYDQLAQEVVESLSSTMMEHHIPEKSYSKTLETIISSVLASVLNETEVSELSKERQIRRVLLIDKFLRVSMCGAGHLESNTTQRSNGISSSQTNSIDNGTQPLSGLSNTTTQQSRGFVVFDWSWSKETGVILSSMFNLVSEHISKATKENVDFVGEIYHIQNIFLIIEVLQRYFTEISLKAQTKLTSQQADVLIGPESLTKALTEYEGKLAKDQALFGVDSPFVLLKIELRNLLLVLRTLRSLFK